MKKVINQKKLFWRIQLDLKQIWNNFIFVDNSKSKNVANVHCAYASKDKIIRIWPNDKKLIFISDPKSSAYRHFMT